MFNLKEYLKNRAQVVEQELDKALRDTSVRPSALHEAMRYSLFTGGKRLRPVLCLAACEMAGGSPQDAMPAALALEVFHTYTLVHDDLPCMDNDDFRRGKPTVHRKYDEPLAILTGDALQAFCFELLATASPRNPFSVADLVKEMAVAGGSIGVVGGQVEDIAYNEKELNTETLNFIHYAKTARLFIASVRLGAMCAGADKKTFDAASSYGNHLGIAFQLADDILDGIQDADSTGSIKGDGNLSCLSIMTPEAATALLQDHLSRAQQALDEMATDSSCPLIEIAGYIYQRVLSGQDAPEPGKIPEKTV